MRVLLIAHGSADPRHSAAIESFAQQVHAASGFTTTVGYLDHNSPRVEDALRKSGELAASEPHNSVSTVGLFLSTGYHVSVDVPRVLTGAGPAVTDCGTLGLGDWLLPVLNRAFAETVPGAVEGHGVALMAPGSSRSEARDAIADLAARWQRQRGVPVRAAFATGPGTTLEEAMRMLGDNGCDQPVVISLVLAPGSMADRVSEQSHRAGTPVSPPLLSQVPAPPELLARVLHLVSG